MSSYVSIGNPLRHKRLRFLSRGRPVVYMLAEATAVPVSTLAIWGVPPDGSGPYRLANTEISEVSGDLLADPMVSPDGSEVVFAVIGSGVNDTIHVAPSGGSGSSAAIDTDTSLPDVSMQPHWHPDGTKVIWRDLISGAGNRSIKRVNRDGTGSTTLKTDTNTIKFPRYNRDGTLIAYVLDKATDELWVMNADGTGATMIKTGLFTDGAEPSWAHSSDRLAYWTSGGQWRVINADGTGDTLLATDPNPFWGLTRNAWAPDDSALLVFYRDPAASPPRGKLTSISTTGGGATTLTPNRFSYVLSEKHLPHVFGDRVYWILLDGASPTVAQVVSCLPDGSGYRVEHDLLTTIPSPYVSLGWRGFDGRSA